MPVSLRPFGPDDYAAVVAVNNAVFPDYPLTVEEMRFGDEHRDPKCRHRRWVAEQAGRIVGTAFYGQAPEMYHPRRFEVEVSVVPAARRQGIGAALYDQVMAALEPFEPLSVYANAREDMAQSVRFLERRGFQERMREWESRLTVADFDPTPFAGVGEAVRAQGIEIRTLAELAADPDHERNLHALTNELERDVPSPEPVTETSFEFFVDHLRHSPNLLPDAYFVAVHGDEYVGLTTLWAIQSSADLETGLTAVKRAYRRRGIALALKARAIAYARERGHPVIKTWNATRNEGMLAINQRLGFVRQPAWITLVKGLRAGE